MEARLITNDHREQAATVWKKFDSRNVQRTSHSTPTPINYYILSFILLSSINLKQGIKAFFSSKRTGNKAPLQKRYFCIEFLHNKGKNPAAPQKPRGYFPKQRFSSINSLYVLPKQFTQLGSTEKHSTGLRRRRRKQPVDSERGKDPKPPSEAAFGGSTASTGEPDPR